MDTDLTQSPELMQSGGQPIVPTGQVPLTPSEAAPSAPQVTNAPINQRPAPPQAQVQPQAPKESTFHKALQALAGGASRVQDPTTGEVKEVPMTKGTLSKHILAGAISGIMEGWAKSSSVPVGPGGSRSGQVAAAAGGAFEGTQNKLNEIKNKPQAQMDEQQARKYNILQRNIALHGAMLTAGNASRAAQDAIDAPGLDLLKAADDFSAGDTSGVPLIADRGLSYQEIMKKYPDMSKNNFIPMGHRDMLNPDGSPALDPKTGIPMREPLFAVVNPEAKISLTPQLKETFGKMQPGLSKLADNTPINLKAFLSMQTQHINTVTGADAMESAAKQIDAVTGSASSGTDFQKAIQSDPVLRKNAAVIGQYLGHGNNVVEGMEALSKQAAAGKLGPDGPAVVGRLGQALGLNEVDKSGKTVKERLQMKYDADKLQQKNEEEVKQRARDNEERRHLHAQEVADTQSIKARAEEPVTSNTQHFQNEWTDAKGFNYDLSHPATKLVEGTLTPQQLTKRATKGSDSYNKVIQAADNYSMARYGKPFDFEKAERDSKFASDKGTQNTLKYLNSLVGSDNKGGNLKNLVDQSNGINRTDFPALNDKIAWARLQAGDPSLAAYYTTVTEVADQVAKILQGGSGGSGTSDVKLKQAQEMFNKGFSKDSIKAVANDLRDLLGNRKTELIGGNRYLQKDYGVAGNIVKPPTVPEGKFKAKDAKGNVIGYANDAKGTGFVRF